MDRISELEKQLEQEREKVKGLHEITKVICTHCCEPMEIPSKAVLQTQLTQLQALVRAYGEAKIEFDSGRLREDHHAWKERFERLTTAEQALIATLDATTPDSNQLGDINDMVSKGGDGE